MLPIRYSVFAGDVRLGEIVAEDLMTHAVMAYYHAVVTMP